MSEDTEDVKPKLSLVINYEGTQITVKVKHNMAFKKIFDAAEVRSIIVASNLTFSSICMTYTRNGLEKNQVSGDWDCFREVLYSWSNIQGRLSLPTMAKDCGLKTHLWM
ncbi:hypothetical protein BDR07DRAFT_817092 [Suillus spraguei]|nr:hypothetical protein BDR07DRAFT_817092 [Suillus spraguei]